MGKDLWCPTCQEFPDKIREVYQNWREDRIWTDDLECYEFDDDGSNDYESMQSYCRACGTELEVREEQETQTKLK